MKTNNLENMQLRKHDNKLLKQLEEHANKQLRQQATLTTSNLYNISTNSDNITTSHLENDSKQFRQHDKKNLDNKHLRQHDNKQH